MITEPEPEPDPSVKHWFLDTNIFCQDYLNKEVTSQPQVRILTFLFLKNLVWETIFLGHPCKNLTDIFITGLPQAWGCCRFKHKGICMKIFREKQNPNWFGKTINRIKGKHGLNEWTEWSK